MVKRIKKTGQSLQIYVGTAPLCYILQAKDVFGFFHVCYNLYAKGTARFAGTALDTFAGVVGEELIMVADRFRNFALGDSQVEEFGDIGNADALGTGSTVNATLSAAWRMLCPCPCWAF